ncbi:DNA repair photolyase [Planifilum fulgidum]|uniref:DNA repair photolyase n=2 Tax=Planifilum fulgidum TaxID=201973 RepID=A0A1I2LXL7_9BACL|nr:DNA repair photolyase [Planifilum fulgidum]
MFAFGVIPMAGRTPRRLFPKRPVSVLNRVEGMPFRWSINPYRGCSHGCHFCYARPTHSYLGFHADDSFQHNIIVKRDAAEVLYRELKRRKWKGGEVAVGTATDPYQPVEAKWELTRSILKVLRDFRIPTSITTRSPLILRDRDILREMVLTSVNISLSTLDERVWRLTEPASPHPKQRLEAVRKLSEAGIPAGLFLAPILPYLADSDEHLRSYMKAARECGARFVVPSVLRLRPAVKSWFFRRIQTAFPREYPRLVRLYEGAYPPDEYRAELFARIRRHMRDAGIENEAVREGASPSERETGSGAGIPEEPIQLSLF